MNLLGRPLEQLGAVESGGPRLLKRCAPPFLDGDLFHSHVTCLVHSLPYPLLSVLKDPPCPYNLLRMFGKSIAN